MISDTMNSMLNDQFQKELLSANQYLAMCSYFLDQDLDGFANFFRIQADEEMMHAMKQFDYLHEVDGKIDMRSIDEPKIGFNSILEVFETAMGHEQMITRSINEIVKEAHTTGDFATHNFFQWFIAEQVEEESLLRGIIAKIKLADGNKGALYLLNEELLRRKPDTAEAQ